MDEHTSSIDKVVKHFELINRIATTYERATPKVVIPDSFFQSFEVASEIAKGFSPYLEDSFHIARIISEQLQPGLEIAKTISAQLAPTLYNLSMTLSKIQSDYPEDDFDVKLTDEQLDTLYEIVVDNNVVTESEQSVINTEQPLTKAEKFDVIYKFLVILISFANLYISSTPKKPTTVIENRINITIESKSEINWEKILELLSHQIND